MIFELQRVRRRAGRRKLRVFVLAALITSALTYVVVTKQRHLEAEVILALTEGTMAGERMGGIPPSELREYVGSVLLSDKNLTEVIERENLFPNRKRLGMDYAITELRSQMEVLVWKNTFLFYRDSESRARKSARIGVTYGDNDPDRATSVARALADVMIRTHETERLKLTGALAEEVALLRESLDQELAGISAAISAKQTAMALAKSQGKHGLAAALSVDLANLDSRQKHLEEKSLQVVTSREGIADQIAAAGLDISLDVVEERRPNRPEHSAFALALLAVVIATASVLGAAMIVSTFDPHVHDGDDVARLGLPVLGHVPAFAGDRVGSLRSRVDRKKNSRSGAKTWHSHR